MRQTLFAKIRSVWADRAANVAIMTALCAFPLLGMMGLAIDYALAISTKAKLDLAADAAAVAAITKAKTVIAAGGTVSQAQSQGQAQGLAAFKANMGSLNLVQSPPTPTVTIVQTSQILTANVSYVTNSQNQFGSMFNVPTTRVMGSSASSTVVTPYYQFIFVVDISGSMAIGGTPADITGLTNDPNIQQVVGSPCAFACHDPNHNRVNGDPRAIAKTDGWTLKIDYVNQAIQTFIQDLKTQTAGSPGVFSVGIDTFASTFKVLQAPTTNLAASKTAAAGIDIEPMNPLQWNNGVWDQGYTRTTTSLQAALSNVTNIGDGTAPNKQATYFIFLSDGVEDIEGNLIYLRGTDVTYTSACSTIKSAGATLISIVAPYPVVTDPQYPILVAPLAPPFTPNMTTAMTACATDATWAYQATNGPGINTAVQSALKKILQGMTRLTQ